MKSLNLLIAIFTLSGCVAYPSKHLVSPEYSFGFEGIDASSVRLRVGLESESVCDSGEMLDKIDNRFISSKQHSWIKVVWAFPVTSSNTLYLCAIDSSGNSFEWQTDLYYYGPLEPKDRDFDCQVTTAGLVCNEQTS